MKTKLLKKVRKRYEIIRIDKINSRSNHTLKNAAAINGLPVYQLIDKKYDQHKSYYNNNHDAHVALLTYIKCDYDIPNRDDKNKQSKVWYNK